MFSIIPAIDIINGKCVRLTQGDYSQMKVYNENPLEVAKAFEDIGLQRLHLVDLDGAKEGAVKNWKVLEKIAGKTSMIIDFGGGLKTVADVEIVFNSGAALATVGTLAVKEEELFKMMLQHFGAATFLLGADVKGEKISVSGWTQQTNLYVMDFIRNYQQSGVQQFFCTDISKDGMLEGPATELYKKLFGEIENLQLIASGGVSSMKDVDTLQNIGCTGAIIGKAIYENQITMDQLKDFVRRN